MSLGYYFKFVMTSPRNHDNQIIFSIIFSLPNICAKFDESIINQSRVITGGGRKSLPFGCHSELNLDSVLDSCSLYYFRLRQVKCTVKSTKFHKQKPLDFIHDRLTVNKAKVYFFHTKNSAVQFPKKPIEPAQVSQGYTVVYTLD